MATPSPILIALLELHLIPQETSMSQDIQMVDWTEIRVREVLTFLWSNTIPQEPSSGPSS